MVWGWGIVVSVPVLQVFHVNVSYDWWTGEPIAAPEVACKTYVGMRTHSCLTQVLGEQYFCHWECYGIVPRKLVVLLVKCVL